ncbi:hypothetical protein OPV22_003829 [Ensete ventricosum]|uniref:Aquaporin n=1 Tax=Ensete ventricosum TaxID=4639 RepID=A0AAV8S214_ENSVE|nr:hypothetical protein OPV22_003829 [Ensete ventricosum]
MIFALVCCTAGISGGHINPAVTFGLFLARKLSLTRAVFHMVMQCLGAICGAGAVKGFQKGVYESNGGGPTLWPPATPRAQPGRRDRRHLHPRLHRLLRHRRQEECEGLPCAGKIAIPSSSFLLRLHFMLTEQVGMQQILATLPIGFSVFLVRLATIPITGTGINPAQSLGAAIIYSKDHAWDDHWIFWVGPFIGAVLAAFYHQILIKVRALLTSQGYPRKGQAGSTEPLEVQKGAMIRWAKT